MQVSTVIPVYNASRYVEQAVESALAQPETAEVILVEDGSSDSSLEICQALANCWSQVRLFRHPDGRNCGAGASRNVGIREAGQDFIAFLDADDYFLPGRFTVAKELLETDPELDGVYEAMGVRFEDRASEERWLAERGHTGLTTMTERVAPDELFEKQSPLGSFGYCTTGGWVVKKTIFAKTGLFDEHLRLHQDTVMFVKFAAMGKMLPGRLQVPVAVRRVHAANRSSVPRRAASVYRDRIRMWTTLWVWGKGSVSEARQQLLLRRFLAYACRPYRQPASSLARQVMPRLQINLLAVFYPRLLLETAFWLTYRRVMVPHWLRHRIKRILPSLRLCRLHCPPKE